MASLTFGIFCSIVILLIPVLLLWMWNGEDPK
jgi:hypothetical protein